jgi:hypothetical protein
VHGVHGGLGRKASRLHDLGRRHGDGVAHRKPGGAGILS